LLDSKNSKYHREKAAAYSEMEMFDQALGEFDKAIEIEPEIVDYRRDKASLLLELSRHEEAVKTIEDLLKIKSGYPDIWVTYAEALTYARGQKDGIEGLYKGIRGKSVTPKQLCEAVSDQLKKDSPQSVKQMFIQYYRENCDKK
jgi:tetratricopeptide (TPR) repeat protein